MDRRSFRGHEDGAVTIDWVALVAGLLITSLVILPFLGNELQSVVDAVETAILEAPETTIPVDN
ncbi:MAG: hypothetical protein ACFBWO_02580 [Paracoccaceae bacterium]